ncbi:alpha/beta fold hydrolase [Quisquiliibacterium transsilvanicum]|uniref:Pimeloyl-ACP methyl ester carboxylesterase n=1 Tax=Quisquiliibacterium transsilvanicum TaxID=1549638 RepID=A0A7W8HH24_9BURK|nr:pimeloyl-ACP methyl ester carboxylesterase [Quisquiliibacterium transsilvanicum]
MPKLRQVQLEGLSLAAFEWNAALRGSAPTLLLVHATGFHARVWDQMVRRLPPVHVLAIELRGHGRSQALPFAGWEDFGRDLAQAAIALDLEGAVGVGHSMGGHALVAAAAAQPRRFARLMLIDPPMFAPESYLNRPPLSGEPHPAVGRKNRFESPQAMFDRLAQRPPYSTWDPQALRDYCVHGLRPAADGEGFELACAPATEGRVYDTVRRDAGIYASVRALRIPVTVVRARALDESIRPFDTLGSPTWPGLAAEFRDGRDLHLPDKSHLMPMEDPALVAGLIAEELFGAAPRAEG